MNKTEKIIQIHEWATCVEVKTQELDCVRRRYAYNLKDFNAILKSELAEARSLGLAPKIQRSGVGKFRGITWKNLYEMRTS